MATILLQRQFLFAKLLPKLIDYIYEQDFTCTMGELYRPPETAQLYARQGKGVAHSCHVLKLAVDINLFSNGVYISDSMAHKPFGEYWKSLDPLCNWGGDFTRRPDGNHYSITSPEGFK